MQEVALGVLAGLWAGGVQHVGVPAAIRQLSAVATRLHRLQPSVDMNT